MSNALMDLPAAPKDSHEAKPLSIFVHRASEYLTDHLPHGDGLICYSLLAELARRGHRVIACTNRNGVADCPANLDIREQNYKIPANSLGDWELGIRANRLLRDIARTETIDLVWRMHPYQASSPIVPYTGGRPLVIGPLFDGWPKESAPANDLGKPRFGIGIRGLLSPFADHAWNRTMQRASLVICATRSLAEKSRPLTGGRVMTLPVIVEPPSEENANVELRTSNFELRNEEVTGESLPSSLRRSTFAFPSGPPIRLLFAANLYRNKNPLVFCQIVAKLKSLGISAVGEVLGDGPERTAMEQWCAANSVADSIQFSGRLPNTEVYRRLASADGLISTSLGEPYGRGIAEAMSVGAVPICHRSGGPVDFIDTGVDGLLVDRIDADDYAAAIASAWRGPGVWDRLSSAAQSKARKWTTEIVVDDLESALYALPRVKDCK